MTILITKESTVLIDLVILHSATNMVITITITVTIGENTVQTDMLKNPQVAMAMTAHLA